ncbi:amidase [Actinobacteria bacterium YIM 96077]|uniref:Amidase n=1 Tax=Phytoactinopolyspora halophila TaxID=1981511 RepID=A0A329QQV5_9ACTN|nr:amidase [Phytoactinopolyspora halophila]AYY14213.1 amidase [Actinobacteria bacterium YIM 96077]RAW14755.1 amidase [Phytoactinopolyspora halophila]
MTEIHELTALDIAAAIRAGDLSPTEVVEHSLDRAQRLDPQLGAFVELTPELAREQARARERALAAAGRYDGSGPATPLLGVPCPIKDLVRVAGVPVRYGSAALGDADAPVDDGVVTLLNQAGTVTIGKTNTPEVGLPAYTEPDIAPPARSPWDTRRSAGGSSGGAAAAVAAGIVPMAHGNDGGGSIRIPASACGLVGLKPTRGRVSPGPHGVEGAGLAINGVLTRDVRDTAAALDVLSASWPGDQFILAGPKTSYVDACAREPGTLRVGVLTTPIIADVPVDPSCITAVEETAALLEELGHHVEHAPVPFPAQRWSSFEALWSVLALSIPLPPEAEDRLVPLTRWLREQGRSVSGLDYASAVTSAQETTREAAVTWAGYDVIVSPTLARPPAFIGELRNDDDPAADFAAQVAYTPWTSVWNLTGWPAISLPLSWTRGGAADDPPVPVGVMLGGQHGTEEMLLSLSAQLEVARPWRHYRPPEPPGSA